jgi:hypothetical protein
LLKHRLAINAKGLRRGIEVEAMPRLVLDFSHQNGLALQTGGSGDPVSLRLHTNNLGMSVLRDLTYEGLTIALGHPVRWFHTLLVGQQLGETGCARFVG